MSAKLDKTPSESVTVTPIPRSLDCGNKNLSDSGVILGKKFMERWNSFEIYVMPWNA